MGLTEVRTQACGGSSMHPPANRARHRRPAVGDDVSSEAITAEAELLRINGLDWLFGSTPRVHQEVNYRNRLWFGDLTTTRMELVDLGRTSMRLSFEVTGPNGQVAAEGSIVTVYSPPEETTAVPWPDSVRQVFAHR